MNLTGLRYFYDTSITQSIAQTAKKYSVPPSAVSSSIKKLEDELGVKLFERSSNTIRLNEKGKAFALELGVILGKLDSSVRDLVKKEEKQTVIRVLSRARPKWITELICEYKERNQSVNFVVSNDYLEENIDDFDIVIDEKKQKYSAWESFLLSVEIICIKASSKSPLVHKSMYFKDLKNEDFILPSIGNGMRHMYERLCRSHSFEPRVTIECNDRQCLQHYVRSNMGLTIGATRALGDNTQDGISPLKVLDFSETQSVYVFYKKSDENNTHLKEFRDFLYTKRYI